MFSVDNVVPSNSLLLTTKYSSTASSSSGVHPSSASQGGSERNLEMDSGVNSVNPVTADNQLPNESSDSDSDDDFDELIDWQSLTLPGEEVPCVMYGPSLPPSHKLFFYRIDKLIHSLKMDPSIITVHVPSKRNRSSLGKSNVGQGRPKKSQKESGPKRVRPTLYSLSTPLVLEPSFRSKTTKN